MTADFQAAIPQRLGPYSIRRVLGRGAMSTVYLAVDPGGGELVALKVLRPELLAGPERVAVLARFRREAAIGMRLQHPNIVRVDGCGSIEGAPYLTMEVVDGKELAAYLATESNPALPLESAVGLLRGVLSGLGHAHDCRVVHRDVKLANILVTGEGVCKVTDFGIAHEEGSDITAGGELLGTPAYIAPEVLKGQSASTRSDLFSFGVMAYYLLTGQRPFSGSVGQVMLQILHSDPLPPSRIANLPPSFDTILLRSLAKLPELRPRDTAEVSAALAQALAAVDGRGIGAPCRPRPAADDVGIAATVVRVDATLADELAKILRSIAATPLGERQLARIGDQLKLATGATGETRDRVVMILGSDGAAALAGLIADGMPSPGTHSADWRADFMLLVRLLAAVGRTLKELGAPRSVETHMTLVAADIVKAFLAYAERLTAELGTQDNPDVMRLSAEFLRLEVLLHALEELEMPGEARTAASTMAMLTGQVMRAINRLLRACTQSNDGFARFGVSLMLGDVEDLIDIARRALDGGTAAGGLASFREDGREQVREFVALARAFAELSAKELRATGASMEAEVFAAKLRPLSALYQLATRVPADAVRDEMTALTVTLHRGMAALVAVLGQAEGPVPERIARVTTLYEMARALGWRELATASLTLLRRLAAGRDFADSGSMVV